MAGSPRIRRLRNDYEALSRLRAESTIFDFRFQGAPPDRYMLFFEGSGLALDPAQGVQVVTSHRVDAALGAEYPRLRPDLRWVTPFFHPNVSESGMICLGGYTNDWVPGLALDRLCGMIWDVIRWENFDPRSPYNIKAARWANTQTDFRFPLDRRQIRDRAGSERTGPADGARGAGGGISFVE